MRTLHTKLLITTIFVHINLHGMQQLFRKRSASTGTTSHQINPRHEKSSPRSDENIPTDRPTLSQQLLRNANTDDVTLITSLVEQGANPNTRCSITHMTSLHRAAATDQAGIVSLLLQYEADPNAQDIHGCTPLHYAALHSSKSTIDHLLKFGANPYIKNNNGLDVYEFIDTYKPYTPDVKQIILDEMATIEQFTEVVSGFSPRKREKK